MSGTAGRAGRWAPGAALLLLAGATMVPLVAALIGGDVVGDPVDTLLTVVAAGLTGAWLRPATAVPVCAVGAALLTAANQLAHPGQYSAANDLFFFAVMIGGTALAGALVVAQRKQATRLLHLADVREVQRDAELRAAALQERNRVEAAVTESMLQRLGGVVVQVAGARSRPAAADALEALHRIEEAGRATLEDLRRTLGWLRTPSEGGSDALAEPVPEPVPAPLRASDLLVACCGVPVAVEAVAGASAHGPVVLNLLCGVAVGAPLLVRRTRPVTATLGAVAAAAAMSAWLTPLTETVSILLPLSLTAFAVGAHTRGPRRVVAVAVLLLGSLAVTFVGPGVRRPTDGLVPTLVWLGVAVAAGVITARHAARAARLRDLLARIEAGQGAQLRLAVEQQRAAVARDLHDTVAHAMTVVCLHSQAAQRGWPEPTSVERSLAVVESVAREAMSGLRQGLLVLETSADLVDDLRRLAASLGLVADVRQAGRLPPLAAPAELLVRRVAREALTNAARHAPGSPVRVEIATAEGELVVDVSNPTGGPGGSYGLGSASGLQGLGQLVEEQGGRLEHGSDAGAFRVRVRLPTRPGVPA